MDTIEIEVIDSDLENGYINTSPPILVAYCSLKELLNYCSFYLNEYYIVNDSDNVFISVSYKRNFDIKTLQNQINYQKIINELISFLNLERIKLPIPRIAIDIDYLEISNMKSVYSDSKPVEGQLSIKGSENSFARCMSDFFEVSFVSDSENKCKIEKYEISFSEHTYYENLSSPIGLSKLLIKNGFSNNLVEIPQYSLKKK